MNNVILTQKIEVANKQTIAIQYQSVPVMTTEQLAGFYSTEAIRIQQNHLRNANRFEEGKHFFKVEGDALRELKLSLSSLKIVSPNTRSLILWTEKGAARHAKILETDQAWDVFEQLEDVYFAVKEQQIQPQKPAELSRMQLIQLALEAEQENQALRGRVAVLEPKAQALDTIANTENTYCIRECAKTIGIKESDLIQLLLDKKWCYRDTPKPNRTGRLQPHAQYVTNGVFINRASPVIANKNSGKEEVHLNMRVTAFGLTRITGLVERSKKLKVVA